MSGRQYGPEPVSVLDEVLQQPGYHLWTWRLTDQQLVVQSGRGQWRVGRRHGAPSSDCEVCRRRWTSRRRSRLTSDTWSYIRRHRRRCHCRLVMTARPSVPLRHRPASDQSVSTSQSLLRVASCCYSNTPVNSLCCNPSLYIHTLSLSVVGLWQSLQSARQSALVPRRSHCQSLGWTLNVCISERYIVTFRQDPNAVYIL